MEGHAQRRVESQVDSSDDERLDAAHGTHDNTCTRRRVIQAAFGAAVSLIGSPPAAGRTLTAAPAATVHGQSQEAAEPYGPGTLPAGIRSRFVDGVNGLRVHVLEAGVASGTRPCVLLLHGFPELAFSWRKVMVPLADAGFHVIAPDLRGYGRTTGWDDKYDTDLMAFGLLNYVRDALGLVFASGYRSVAAVIGHDFGSVVAPWCPLIRPDVFRSVVLMSAPFAGPPPIPSPAPAASPSAGKAPAPVSIDEALAQLQPPRKQYRRYYSTREANRQMLAPPQGLHAFLRAYYHVKSADWRSNQPFPLAAMTASELAKLPTYYIMEADATMPQTVAPAMPSPAEIAACRWLSEPELSVYVGEYQRTGFQGGLDGYRVRLTDAHTRELALFAGRTVDVPALFIGGKSDWGVYQTPGALESMRRTAFTRLEDVVLVDGAGHWVQQEQPEQTVRLLLAFLRRHR